MKFELVGIEKHEEEMGGEEKFITGKVCLVSEVS